MDHSSADAGATVCDGDGDCVDVCDIDLCADVLCVDVGVVKDNCSDVIQSVGTKMRSATESDEWDESETTDNNNQPID